MPLNDNVNKLISHTMPEILESFDMEDDKYVFVIPFLLLVMSTLRYSAHYDALRARE